MALYTDIAFGRADRLDQTGLNKRMKMIADAIETLRAFSPDWEAQVRALRDVGLQRINEALLPAYDTILGLAQLGALFTAPSASEVTVGIGEKLFIVDEARRVGFAPAANLAITLDADPGVAMYGRLSGYDRESGTLAIIVTDAFGEGVHSGWTITASPPRSVLHELRLDNPHQVTAGQVGTLTAAEIAAALALKADEEDVAGALAEARDDVWIDINVSEINGSNILTLPDEGNCFRLTGHGAADFTIAGFGTARRAGRAFKFYVPRTIALTGGSVYNRGSKVSFIHSTSGPGLDLTANRQMINGSPVYTYEAYPNARDGAGTACGLYEVLTFVPVGEGRHELRGLPAPVVGENANGWYVRHADGRAFCEKTLTGLGPISNAHGSVFISADINLGGWPNSFLGMPVRHVSAFRTGLGTLIYYSSAPGSTSAGLVALMRGQANAATDFALQVQGVGRWK